MNFRERQFLFEELVRRDFKKKYKRSILGIGWSALSPMMTLAVLWFVFSQFFGRSMEHFTTYLLCGNVLFTYFSDGTREGMVSLRANASIYSKVKVPKFLFLLSKNIQVLINFSLSLAIVIAFALSDRIAVGWHWLLLLYPIVTLTLLNIGIGAVLSAFFVFFDDMFHLWNVFVQLIMYGSAIFYPVACLPSEFQMALACNPVYRHIAYFREVLIAQAIPSVEDHLILLGTSLLAVLAGFWMYRRYDSEFLYYV